MGIFYISTCVRHFSMNIRGLSLHIRDIVTDDLDQSLNEL